MKSLLSLLALVMLSASVYACGGTGKASSTSSTSTTPTITNSADVPPAPLEAKPDSDKDNDGHARNDDTNNDSTLNFGHEADASDTRAITALVKHYYADAIADNGVKACTLVYSTVAETAPETFGQSPPGPPYAHGATCPQIMLSLFKHFHSQLAAEAPKLRVSRVRLVEHHGFAVLTFGTLPERKLSVDREGRVWKLETLIDSELP